MGNHYVFFGNSGQLEGGQDEVERGPLEPGEEHGGGGALVQDHGYGEGISRSNDTDEADKNYD